MAQKIIIVLLKKIVIKYCFFKIQFVQNYTKILNIIVGKVGINVAGNFKIFSYQYKILKPMFYIEVSKISYILKHFKVIKLNTKSQLFLTSKLRYCLDQDYDILNIQTQLF